MSVASALARVGAWPALPILDNIEGAVVADRYCEGVEQVKRWGDQQETPQRGATDAGDK